MIDERATPTARRCSPSLGVGNVFADAADRYPR